MHFMVVSLLSVSLISWAVYLVATIFDRKLPVEYSPLDENKVARISISIAIISSIAFVLLGMFLPEFWQPQTLRWLSTCHVSLNDHLALGWSFLSTNLSGWLPTVLTSIVCFANRGPARILESTRTYADAANFKKPRTEKLLQIEVSTVISQIVTPNYFGE